MWIRSLIDSLACRRRRTAARPKQSVRRLFMEGLEGRSLMTFTPATLFPAGLDPVTVVTADFNDDGRLDLAAANVGNATVSILLGNGQGGFGIASDFATGDSPSSLVAGDFDGDGNLDLVTANQSLRYLSVLRGNGNGVFQPPVTTDISRRLPDMPVSLAPVADFNADGKSDLALVTYVYSDWFANYSGVEALLSDGQGGFADHSINVGSGDAYTSVAVADLNADGKPDVVTTSSYFDEGIGDFVGYVNVFSSDRSYGYSIPTGPGGTPQVALGDFTRDNIRDLVVTDWYGQTLDVLPGDGGGGFGDPIGSPISDGVRGVADFNGDGNMDVDLGGSVRLGLGNGTFTGAFAAATAPTVGDFNGDGLPDVVSIDSNALAVRLNDRVWPPMQQIQPAIRIGNANITEGNTGATSANFTITLSEVSAETITVNYSTADYGANAGSDYVAGSGALSFAPGETSKTIAVLVNGDRVGESNESFIVNLSAAMNAIIAVGQGVGTITDDEPHISINDATISEGNTGTRPIAFTVSLSMAYDVPVTINYATANSTATAGGDYQAKTNALTIPAGQISGTITMQVSGDRLAESNETFFVNLSNPNYGTIADGQGIGTIVDDEPQISISDVTKSEGKKNQSTLFSFTVTLSSPYDQPVTMSFKTVDGGAKSSDQDYVAKTGTLTFAPGETTKTITITVYGDSKKESNETFYLDLYSNSSNSQFKKNRGLGTILNDD